MQPDVIPILIPQIDVKSLISYCVNFLERSPSKGLDTANQPVNTYPAYLRMLQELQGSAIEDKLLAASLSFGFLIYTTPSSISELGGLCQGSSIIAKEGSLIILTQTLLQWWTLSVANCSHLTPETQFALQRINYFLSDQLGLRNLWADYTRDRSNQLVLRR